MIRKADQGMSIYDARQRIIDVADEAISHWLKVRKVAATVPLSKIDYGLYRDHYPSASGDSDLSQPI